MGDRTSEPLQTSNLSNVPNLRVLLGQHISRIRVDVANATSGVDKAGFDIKIAVEELTKAKFQDFPAQSGACTYNYTRPRS